MSEFTLAVQGALSVGSWFLIWTNGAQDYNCFCIFPEGMLVSDGWYELVIWIKAAWHSWSVICVISLWRWRDNGVSINYTAHEWRFRLGFQQIQKRPHWPEVRVNRVHNIHLGEIFTTYFNPGTVRKQVAPPQFHNHSNTVVLLQSIYSPLSVPTLGSGITTFFSDVLC